VSARMWKKERENLTHENGFGAQTFLWGE